MSFEDNPADDRYQLDQCIDEIKSLQSQILTLTAELATLKSAPGMEEVDALVAREDVLSAKMSAGHFLLFINACDLARRSISSREEVVGMLSDTERLIKWMVKHWNWTGKLESIAEGCVIEPWKENARLVLEIVEGK